MISLSRLRSELGVDAETASKIQSGMRDVHRGADAHLVMVDIARLMSPYGYYGTESLPSKDDTYREFKGVEYLNAGDPYSTTLMYDHGKRTWRIGSWGDIVEKHPRRFGSGYENNPRRRRSSRRNPNCTAGKLRQHRMALRNR